MESEKRWVTIDGRHVDIGGDGDSGSGGGASRKPKPDGYIEPMPKKQFRKIKKAFEKMATAIPPALDGGSRLPKA